MVKKYLILDICQTLHFQHKNSRSITCRKLGSQTTLPAYI